MAVATRALARKRSARGTLAACGVIAVASMISCKESPKPVQQAPTAAASEVGAAPAMSGPHAHDPAHPPIDCPLREAGVDHHGHRPFDDVKKYAAFLESPERAAWQKPDALVSFVGLKGDEVVADVGAGTGYFAFRFAKALPRGKVIASDIEPEMVRHIHHKAMTEGVSNVQAVLGAPDDPRIPSTVGIVFVCDVLHHVQDQLGWLKKIHQEVGAGARLIVVEFREGDLPQGPPKSMKIPSEQVTALAIQAGFKKLTEDTKLLPYQYVLTFEKR